MLFPIKLDLNGLRKNLLRERTPERVYFFEHGESDEFKNEIVRRFGLTADNHFKDGTPEFSWQREIAIQRFLGHEVFRIWLPGAEFQLAGSKGTTWAEEHKGPIQSWEDLETYNWPEPKKIDYSQLDWYEHHLPQDMAVLHVTKVWEVVRELFGFETFCTKLYEDPHLVEEMIRRVGEFHMGLTRTLCDYHCVFAVYGTDDYAYKTSTMMAPNIIKEKFLPWHRMMAQEVHEHGKLYFLHCCGKIDAIMDTLIDDVKMDAKHSFEDTIEPVTEAKRRWGDRVALLGGVDVDFMARSNESTIKQRIIETLDVCMSGGGYCLGLGNWVTNYIPVDNYLAMLDEGRRYGRV
ncbi:MAG: hypothetical protein HY606_08865 [Planctomycetes bacterium]|nr:hypothetical protein [Planctomycetota bacterium]